MGKEASALRFGDLQGLPVCETLQGEDDSGTEVDPGPVGTTVPGSAAELHPLFPLSNWQDH